MSDTRVLTVTDLPCAKGRGKRHLFGRESPDCVYCNRTVDQIRRTTPVLHTGNRCYCVNCMEHPVPRCVHCHLSMSVHPKCA
jgi:hypothetical protein